MDPRIYKKIYSELDNSNIKSISTDFGVSEDVLTCILNQKMIRSNKALYYKVSNNADALLARWEEGESLVSLSDETGLSYVLMSMILLKRKGITRKAVRRMLKNPEEVSDERLKKELCEVIKNDNLFSPETHSLQVKRAKKCEGRIRSWLLERDIQFLTEEDIKKHTHTKTPDFLLKSPLDIDSTHINWIESKGLFGDTEEHRRFLDKQYLGYVRFFGPGLVIYWYGFVDSIAQENSEILIKDNTYFGADNVKYLQ